VKNKTIIWDFDGTLLPQAPYDSEQTLMLFKLDETIPRPPCIVRAVARLMIGADRRQVLRKTFKRFYIRLMKGTPTAVMDQIGRRLSDRIPPRDRQAIRRLKSENYRMLVLSCGTADLSERTLADAGLGGCFETIAGNRFKISQGVINGMTLHVANPVDKVKWLESRGISAEEAIAVGDGYTDIPLLDWAKVSVLLDRSGKKHKKYAHKNYHFVQSLSEILNIVENSL
jgi:phosphoserine phosphatase